MRNLIASVLNDFIIDDPFLYTPEFSNSRSNAIKNYNSETGEYNVWIEAPGFVKDEINVEVEGNRLFIKGERKNEDLIQDIGHKTFNYTIYEKGINPKTINATLRDGILNIVFKTDQKQALKKIDVKYLNA